MKFGAVGERAKANHDSTIIQLCCTLKPNGRWCYADNDEDLLCATLNRQSSMKSQSFRALIASRDYESVWTMDNVGNSV